MKHTFGLSVVISAASIDKNTILAQRRTPTLPVAERQRLPWLTEWPASEFKKKQLNRVESMATGPDDYRPKCNISTRCNVSTVRLNCSYGYTPCASFSSSHIPGALALATPTTASCITENERTKSASWITEGTKQHGRGRVKTTGRKQTSHWHLHSNLAPLLN